MLTTDRPSLFLADGFAALRAWRAERMPLARFGPLALLLAVAASVATDAGWVALLVKAFLALLLLTQFRLWDDLVDVGRDRAAHPERTLTCVGDLRVVVAACVVLGLINAFVLYRFVDPRALTGFVLLNALLGLCYGFHAGRGMGHLHLLLLKYPAFVLLLGAPALATETLAAAAAIYVAVCLFDLLDDRRDATALKIAVLWTHGLSLSVLACVPGADAIGVATGIAVAALVGFACMGPPHPGIAGIARRNGPFVAALLVLIQLSLGGHP